MSAVYFLRLVDTLASDVFRHECEDENGGAGLANLLLDGGFVHRETAAELAAEFKSLLVVIHEFDMSVDDNAAESERPGRWVRDVVRSFVDGGEAYARVAAKGIDLTKPAACPTGPA